MKELDLVMVVVGRIDGDGCLGAVLAAESSIVGVNHVHSVRYERYAKKIRRQQGV